MIASFLRSLFGLKKKNRVGIDTLVKKDDIENKNKSEAFDFISDTVYDGRIDIFKMSGYKDSLKNLIYVLNMHYQVMNGGLLQFVDNSTGDDFHETENALEGMGLPKHVKMLEEYKKIFPNQLVPKNMELRRSLIDTFNEDLPEEREIFVDDLDRTYYLLENEFEQRIVEYVKVNIIGDS